jgi:hypothetical protein
MKFAHPVVLLLGAGATRGGLRKRPIPPPVDADFFELARQIKGHGTPELAAKVVRSPAKNSKSSTIRNPIAQASRQYQLDDLQDRTGEDKGPSVCGA